MSTPIDREKLRERFDYWTKKLRLHPGWDVELEWVEELAKWSSGRTRSCMRD